MKTMLKIEPACTENTVSVSDNDNLRRLTAGQTICIPTELAVGAYNFLSWYVDLIEKVGEEDSNLIDINCVKDCRDRLYDALCGPTRITYATNEEYRYKE